MALPWLYFCTLSHLCIFFFLSHDPDCRLGPANNFLILLAWLSLLTFVGHFPSTFSKHSKTGYLQLAFYIPTALVQAYITTFKWHISSSCSKTALIPLPTGVFRAPLGEGKGAKSDPPTSRTSGRCEASEGTVESKFIVYFSLEIENFP